MELNWAPQSPWSDDGPGAAPPQPPWPIYPPGGLAPHPALPGSLSRQGAPSRPGGTGPPGPGEATEDMAVGPIDEPGGPQAAKQDDAAKRDDKVKEPALVLVAPGQLS